MEAAVKAPLTFRRADWSDEIAAWLDQARGAASLRDYQLQISSGAALFSIHHGDAMVGAFLLRVEHHAAGSQGVIVAGAAQLAGVDMLAACMPAIESLFMGCTTVRLHTSKPALARRVSRMGYTGGEIVCIKQLRA